MTDQEPIHNTIPIEIRRYDREKCEPHHIRQQCHQCDRECLLVFGLGNEEHYSEAMKQLWKCDKAKWE